MSAMPPNANRAVEILLDAIAPERKDELQKLWAKYGPQFQLLDDDGPDGPFILDAGAYRFVRFNHRVMRLFWLGAFIAFEGYCTLHALLLNGDRGDFTRFRSMIDT